MAVPNNIPFFAPLSTDVVAEGVNPPAPFDDKDPNSDFNFLTLQEGSVSYSLIFPDGQVINNTNPGCVSFILGYYLKNRIK